MVLIFMETMNEHRKNWIDILSKIANPVLINMANGTLKKNMPVEAIKDERSNFAYLEAVGRLICGISPWLELGCDDTYEGKLRKKYIDYITKGLVNICNPDSDDYLIFEGYTQPLVDVAFLAQGILRAKTQLWDKINDEDKTTILNAFKKTRSIQPYNNNWVLFASMVETFFLETTGECDMDRLMCGINKFLNEWYCGDGHYSDGEDYHFDYYNSFVIHPMLTEILMILTKHELCNRNLLNTQLNRLKQYATHLERLIAPDGTYPIIGRSIVYRTGAFHALSLACLLKLYGTNIKPEQVRSALSAVINRQFADDTNFDDFNWLKLGFNGHQREIAESYINTGSLYLCSTIFLPLGLKETDEFWSKPYENWTSIKFWQRK